MKNKIDSLVRGILNDLAQPEPTPPELALVLASLGVDSYSRAIKQRDILMKWAEGLESVDDRQYAQQQLDVLPAF